MQPIAAIVFTDLAALQRQDILFGPAQHSLKVRAWPGANQYVKLISGASAALRADAPVGVFAADGDARRTVFASAVPVPRRAPSRAGKPANRTVAAAIAANARSTRSSPAGRSRPRKNFLGMTLAGPGTAFFSAGFRSFSRSR